MTLVPIQECRTIDGWQPVEVPSHSEPHKKYLVMVNPWGETSEDICECEGYTYRGHCSHQEEATQKLCLWSGAPGESEIEQTDEQREHKICPQCGESTKYALEWIND